MKAVFALFVLALLSPAASAATIWSIWWTSDPLPCNYWDKPMTRAALPCNVQGSNSICPNPNKSDPWDQGQPITVVGWSLIQELSDPTAQGKMIVGNGMLASGADVFGTTAGVGTNSHSGFFPPGLGFPEGPQGYFDVYGTCQSGANNAVITQTAWVVIYYTSP